MILYVNGDSHSEGHDAGGPEFAYGKYVADSLNFEYFCDAVASCSNDSIVDRTLKYLESNTPDFIIIGWSTWERETWYYANEEYNITASGADTVHPDLKEKYKQWVINQINPEVQCNKEFTAHEKIWDLHNQLRNIPHLFFNCYSHFFYTINRNRMRHDWADNYVDPYDKNMTYYFWLKQQGFKPSNPEFYHYGADAHRAWADFLLPKVQTVLTQKG